MLLGLISEWEGVGARALDRLQVRPKDVRAQIETLHPQGEQPAGDGHLGMTLQGKASLELAVQEAQFLNHHYLGTEHLLLGLLREEEGLASKVLLKSGVTLEKAHETVKQLLTEHATSNAESRPRKEGKAT